MARRTPPAVGVRSTRQRAEVAELLARSPEFKTAQALYAELREAGSTIGLTTVYRTLQSMAEAELVDVLRNDAGESIYRLCTDTHHHHLVCRECGRAVELEAPEVEAWASRVAARNGYSEVDHLVELFGRCAPCAEAETTADESDPAG